MVGSLHNYPDEAGADRIDISISPGYMGPNTDSPIGLETVKSIIGCGPKLPLNTIQVMVLNREYLV